MRFPFKFQFTNRRIFYVLSLLTVYLLIIQVFVSFMGIKTDEPAMLSLFTIFLSFIFLALSFTNKSIKDLALSGEPIEEINSTDYGLIILAIFISLMGILAFISGWCQYFGWVLWYG